VFGFDPPDEIVQDMKINLSNAAGYTDSKGMFAPRKAVMHYTQGKNIRGVTIDDIYLGNGASELIVMSMNALLNNGDEVLVPAPDYPLWTAAVSLSGGKPVHYICDEQQDWYPDIEDMRSKITPNTRAIVVINPNNPTGALYPVELLLQIIELARQHQLIIYADEIYDKVLYDGAQHVSIASLADDVLFVTFNGLSKNYRACGYRSGWMVVSGENRTPKTISKASTCWPRCACAPTRRGSLRSRLRWAATSRSTTWWPGRAPVEATRPGLQAADRDSGRQRASSRKRRCTCSRASIRRSIRSRMTSSSPTSCWPKRKC
jgi:aspartate/methionine/tyrosine aminotransferase